MLKYTRQAWSLVVAWLVVVVVSAAAPHAATAGTIGFSMTSTVETGPGISLRLEVTNTGDEAAYAVTPTAAYEGARSSGEKTAKILPRATQRWTIPLQDEDPERGAHVMIVRLQYEDANAYPFEVIAAAPFDVGASRRKKVTGRFVVPMLKPAGAVSGKLALNVPPSRGDRFEVEIVVPGGLRTDSRRETFTIGEDRSLRLPVRLTNQSLLAGTQVHAFALVKSVDEDRPQTDVVQGTVRIGSPPPVIGPSTFPSVLVALAVYLLALEIVGGVRRRGRKLDETDGPVGAWAEGALACVASAFLLYHYPWDALLAKTVTAGGDMASLFYPTKLLAEEILPSWQLTGWTMGNYAGFPVFHFYSTLPFALIVMLGELFTLERAFKLVTIAGPTFLPLTAAYLFRSIGYGRGAAALASVSVIPFLFQQGNSMWGGNIPSVLAGEFCHAIGLTLSLVYLGVLHRTAHGRGSWIVATLLLAAIGLSHTFAFFATVWYSLFFVWPRPGVQRLAPPVLAVFAFTFLLLCFWGLPLPSRLIFTTEWSMIWRIKDWKEVLPEPLWPAAWLSAVNVAWMLISGIVLKAVGAGLVPASLRAWLGRSPAAADVLAALHKPFRSEQQGLLIFVFAGGVLLYFLVPAIGFPDIRFVPVSQLFLCLLAADMVFWMSGLFRHRLVLAACVVAGGLAWGQSHLGYIPSWLKWNYTGYEGKTTWSLFKRINDHIRGDLNDPRVVFEHSQIHNRFGSSRAFENLPLFSGRSTLEGVFHQASANSPFIFFLQSEASERGSGPFPQYTYTRMDPAKALPHLRLYNVSQLVVVSEKARAAYEAHPEFERSFNSGQYSVFDVRGGGTGYVVAAPNEPILYDGPDWKLALYRWYKHRDLLDLALVPADLLSEAQAREFELRTDAVTRLPRQPFEEDCEVTSQLEQYRISFDTTCPGRPHIVKVSYFPRWKASDGSDVLPVSPSFMLVYPKTGHFEMYYGRNAIDWIGLGISIVGISLLLVFAVRREWAQAVPRLIAAPFGQILAALERHWIVFSVILLAAAAAGGGVTRVALRAPSRAYAAAQEAYKARDFEEAIRRFEDWTATDKDTFKQATALYQLGVAYTEVGNHAAATQVHERLRFDFSNVDYGAGTLFHLARNYATLEVMERARHHAELLADGYPDASWTSRLRRERPELFDAD